MIIPDINLLLYAHDTRAPNHLAARDWWRQLMDGQTAVALPWAVTVGFVRLSTHPRLATKPLTPTESLDRVESWFARDHVQALEPGPRHLTIVRQLFESTGVAGPLTTDTHLAALAIEYNAELHSNDTDFARFPGLRWHNPIG